MANQYSNLKKEIDSKIKEIEDLLIKGFSAKEISKILDYGYSTVYNAIKRHNLDHFIGVHKNGKSQTSREYVKRIQKFDSETLFREYHMNNLNLYEIAKKYNMSASGVLYYARKLGIKTRDKSEANKLLYQKHPELREIHRQNAYDGLTGIHNPNFNRRETKIEKLFEEYCKSNAIKYEKQYQINGEGHRYDFLVEEKIIVEVDGNYWHNTPKQKSLDQTHNDIALSNGYIIIRFTDKEIKNTKGKCFDKLKKYDDRRTLAKKDVD